jgi:hypothetical protein
MLSSNDVSMVYETLLSSPGMNESVKITLQVPRKNALLLSKIIETGLTVKDDDTQGLFNVAGKDAISELKLLSDDILARAGLTEMNVRLNALQTKK